MTAASIFLLALWVCAHVLILAVVLTARGTRAILALMTLLMVVAYVLKPYTYDLNKYSIFFYTGFIQVQPWHSQYDSFQLDPLDTSGEPFDQAFETGFNWLAKLGNLALPQGSLVPRLDADYGDFKERGPPRSDAMIFLIMGIGLIILLASIRFLYMLNNGESYPRLNNLWTTVPIILGSVFFLLGSQNALRQFLGLAIVILAISMINSKHYLASITLIVLSGVFHQWAPIIGLICIYLLALGSPRLMSNSKGLAHPFQLSPPEVFALIGGVTLVALIKLILIIGAFNLDIPLLDILKSYALRANEFNEGQSLEKLAISLKLTVIVGLFLISEGLIGKTEGKGGIGVDIRLLRRRTLLFIAPFAIYPETFSRLIILYWAVEMLFMVWALTSDRSRVRFAGAAVFIAYGFAPNAINVLIGPNWLYSF